MVTWRPSSHPVPVALVCVCNVHHVRCEHSGNTVAARLGTRLEVWLARVVVHPAFNLVFISLSLFLPAMLLLHVRPPPPLVAYWLQGSGRGAAYDTPPRPATVLSSRLGGGSKGSGGSDAPPQERRLCDLCEPPAACAYTRRRPTFLHTPPPLPPLTYHSPTRSPGRPTTTGAARRAMRARGAPPPSTSSAAAS